MAIVLWPSCAVGCALFCNPQHSYSNGVLNMSDEPDIETSSLLEKTIQLLRESEESYFQIYDKTNLHPNWLSSIATRRNRDPSVNRVQALYEYLSNNKLSV
jgi:hypothetical protein